MESVERPGSLRSTTTNAHVRPVELTHCSSTAAMTLDESRRRLSIPRFIAYILTLPFSDQPDSL